MIGHIDFDPDDTGTPFVVPRVRSMKTDTTVPMRRRVALAKLLDGPARLTGGDRVDILRRDGLIEVAPGGGYRACLYRLTAEGFAVLGVTP